MEATRLKSAWPDVQINTFTYTRDVQATDESHTLNATILWN
jgi:hypothetical protein